MCLSSLMRPRSFDGSEPRMLTFDESSTCNGKPCWENQGWSLFAGRDTPPPLWNKGPFGRGTNRWLSQRFPIALMKRGTVSDPAGVALLPSGLGRHNRITNPLENMNHLLRDHLLLEADIIFRNGTNVSLVLEAAPKERQRLNAVVWLRDHLLASRGIARAQGWDRPGGPRCFEKLFTYPWSCDRDLIRYSSDSRLGTLRRLRRIMPSHHATRMPPPPRLMLLYGRSDARRRRLLNLSGHLAAFRAQFEPSRQVVSWDAVWAKRPSVHRQAEMIRDADVLVTPHGAWPSVWGLFLRRAVSDEEQATVSERLSAIMTSSITLTLTLTLTLTQGHRALLRQHDIKHDPDPDPDPNPNPNPYPYPRSVSASPPA